MLCVDVVCSFSLRGDARPIRYRLQGKDHVVGNVIAFSRRQDGGMDFTVSDESKSYHLVYTPQQCVWTYQAM